MDSRGLIRAFLLFFTIQMEFAQGIEETSEKRLIKELMDGYIKEARPVLNGTEPVHVFLELAINQIIKVDNIEQTITFSGALTQHWEDWGLSWNSSAYDNVRFTVVPSAMVWRPDIGMSSSVNDEFNLAEKTKNKLVVINVDQFSFVWWRVPKVFKSTCQLDMSAFPFDTQNCTIQFASATGYAMIMKFHTSGQVNQELYQPNTEWDLINATGHVIARPTPSVNSTLSVYEVHLILKRRTTYYWIHLIIPCMFISGLVTLVFVMPADAGEKISFSVTILLAFTVYQLIIADSMPKGSTSVSLMSMYLTALVALSAMSVVLSIFVLNIHHRNPRNPLPPFFRLIVFRCLANVVCRRKYAGKWKTEVYPVGQQNKNFDADKKMGSISDSIGRGIPEGKQVVCASIGGIFPQLRSEEEKEQEEPNDWKLAAAILDRFFLLFYVATTFCVNVVLFILPIRS